jgi:hypothetical protein
MSRPILAIVLFAVYWVPTVIAVVRHHHRVVAIGLVNLLLGWSIIGWVAALVWACTAPPREHHRRR